jgi:ATP-dependent Clp protease ATP-binding subunit ClpA
VVFERFTDRARRVLVLAQEEARLLNHGFIGTEHLLLGLLAEGQGVAAVALGQLDVTRDVVREKVVEAVGIAGTPPTGSPQFTPRAKKVLELALREALQLGHNYIGTEHILLGLVREGQGVASQVLVSLGADLARVRQQVIQLLSGYQGSERVGVVAGSTSGRVRVGGAFVNCSFCGRLPPESGKLVTKSGRLFSSRERHYICERCIAEIQERLETVKAEVREESTHKAISSSIDVALTDDPVDVGKFEVNVTGVPNRPGTEVRVSRLVETIGVEMQNVTWISSDADTWDISFTIEKVNQKAFTSAYSDFVNENW